MALALSSLDQTFSGERSAFLGRNFSGYLRGDSNSVLSLASRSLIANQTFYDALIDASIVDYAQKAPSPVLVWSLAYDSVLPANGTRNFAKSGRNNPFVRAFEFDNGKYLTCDSGILQIGPVEHPQAEAVANTFALHFIRQNK